ncbi:MAG TPA: long-chain fatty acid--CoA ligase [Pusillimonas sp.]|jgi:acyl-coenzyme A synthetase/AMP-(fatty) acid ligase|nr:long-chain fatty acid--CoA ligase [Pusillimonas sp.]|tara:strand:+ start:53657 stop:55246 length:1590 start_codon:yes stop_codon:yes gene_type:complete
MNNATATSTPSDAFQPIGPLLSHYAQVHPNKTALVDVDNGQRIGFRALRQAVERSAVALMDAGLQPQERVVLTGENSIAKIILWLAIWRAGGVVCPLDPGFIRSSLNTVVHAINPALILAGNTPDHDLNQESLPHSIRVIAYWDTLDNGVVMLDAHTTANTFTPGPKTEALFPRTEPRDLACIACTSGTTGQPKIVMYDHQAMWLNGLDSIYLLQLSAGDRMLEYRSLNWYSSQILSLMPFLQTGFTLHLARRFSLRRFGQWIHTHQITVSVGVPTIIQLLLKEPITQHEYLLASLRVITSSTAPLAVAHWHAFEQYYRRPLINLYGSTETGWISGNRIHDRKQGSVGRVLNSVQLNFTAQRPLPGDAPTLQPFLVNTRKIALGYLNPDGSCRSLRDQPFLMRDAAQLDAEGYLHVWGRTDDLIIRGGVKISPAEVEAIVVGHPRIQDAAVIGMPDELYGMKIVCFFVPYQHQATSTVDIVQHCRHVLPLEKIPQHLIPLSRLPRNSRGKVIRSQLVSLAQKLLSRETL